MNQQAPQRWPFAIQPPPQKPEHRICLGCGARHPINPDGTPVGGALPCGH
ncbi:hypothetical protein ACTJKQ_14170 [Acidovorax sp. 22279]